MRKEDIKNLEEAYKSITNKEKELISEDANESLGAGLVYLIAFGLPLVFDYFSRKYPELRDKFNQIKLDIKNNQQTKKELQNVLKQTQQQQQPPSDGIASMLSGGVRKPQPRI
jgi:hypothetical protein